MKLKYKLLWIENEKDWLESVEEDIKSMIENNAFLYECHNYAQEEDGLDYNAYDLILMDLNLDSQPSGDLLIKKIRDYGIYTDVVFYSSGGLDNIKQKARDLNLEGVYFSGRNKVQFVDKVCKIIETTIRKVQDLNNLRGLVMAEVSDLDAMMLDIILSGAYEEQENHQYFYNHLINHCEDNIKKSLVKPSDGTCNSSCFHKWKGMPIADIVALPAFESSLKARAVGHLLSSKFYENYFKEIIDVRNNLAHCKSEIIDGKEVLHTLKGGDVAYSADDIVKIRQNITKYRKMFEEYLQSRH